MSIAILFNQKDPNIWFERLKEKLPDEKIEIYPAITNPDDVEFLVTWKPHQDYSKEFKNLKVVQSVGAGVDNLLHTALKDSIKVTRIVDPALKQDMLEHVVAFLFASMKNVIGYYMDQQNKNWNPQSYKTIHQTVITILGLGEIGQFVADNLIQLGFKVQGWSNSKKKREGMTTFAGRDELAKSIESCDFIINLLPLTPETQEILNLDVFKYCKAQPTLINVGRGGHLNDEDTIQALKVGYLKEAYLDVFHQEPLPENHPFWTHPNVFITPHIASITNPETAIDLVLENYNRFKSNQELKHEVNLKRGY